MSWNIYKNYINLTENELKNKITELNAYPYDDLTNSKKYLIEEYSKLKQKLIWNKSNLNSTKIKEFKSKLNNLNNQYNEFKELTNPQNIQSNKIINQELTPENIQKIKNKLNQIKQQNRVYSTEIKTLNKSNINKLYIKPTEKDIIDKFKEFEQSDQFSNEEIKLLQKEQLNKLQREEIKFSPEEQQSLNEIKNKLNSWVTNSKQFINELQTEINQVKSSPKYLETKSKLDRLNSTETTGTDIADAVGFALIQSEILAYLYGQYYKQKTGSNLPGESVKYKLNKIIQLWLWELNDEDFENYLKTNHKDDYETLKILQSDSFKKYYDLIDKGNYEPIKQELKTPEQQEQERQQQIDITRFAFPETDENNIDFNDYYIFEFIDKEF